MHKPLFSLNQSDGLIDELAASTAHQTLAVWGMECAARVLPYFEAAYPHDPRPRQALQTLQDWIDSGVFRMRVIRQAALAAHAAARQTGEDNPARSAARAAGQAVAAAHVAAHAIAAARYALQAIHRASTAEDAAAALAAERNWQRQRLIELRRVNDL